MKVSLAHFYREITGTRSGNPSTITAALKRWGVPYDEEAKRRTPAIDIKHIDNAKAAWLREKAEQAERVAARRGRAQADAKLALSTLYRAVFGISANNSQTALDRFKLIGLELPEATKRHGRIYDPSLVEQGQALKAKAEQEGRATWRQGPRIAYHLGKLLSNQNIQAKLAQQQIDPQPRGFRPEAAQPASDLQIANLTTEMNRLASTAGITQSKVEHLAERIAARLDGIEKALNLMMKLLDPAKMDVTGIVKSQAELERHFNELAVKLLANKHQHHHRR